MYVACEPVGSEPCASALTVLLVASQSVSQVNLSALVDSESRIMGL